VFTVLLEKPLRKFLALTLHQLMTQNSKIRA
jgi:hypothetical protein